MKQTSEKPKGRRVLSFFLVSLTICIFFVSLSFGYYIVDKNTKAFGKFLNQETVFAFFTRENTAYITVFNQNFEVPLPTF